MKILAIDPNDDALTQAASTYRSRNVYPYLESKGFQVVNCHAELACRSYVESQTRQDDIIYVTGVGHGECTKYIGQHCEPIFQIGNYSSQVPKNKVIHFFACRTAVELGPDFVSRGCFAYFGYAVDCAVDMRVSDAFFDCDAEIDRAFADGLTAEDVYDRVIAYYDEKICELEAGGNDYAAAALKRNRDYLRAPSLDAKWGNKKVKIV